MRSLIAHVLTRLSSTPALVGSALAATALLTGCTGALVEPGHRGLLFDPQDGLNHEVLRPGYHHLATLCMRAVCPRVDDFDVTYSTKKEELMTNSSEGLQLDMRIAVIYRPIISELYELDTEVGPNYYDEVVGPEFRSAARGVLARHSYTELVSKNEKIEDEIEGEVRRRIHGKHVEVASITLESINYAPEIAQAVRSKLVGEQEASRQKSAMENEHHRKTQALKNEQEQARMGAENAAEQARLKAEAEVALKEHELAMVKSQSVIDKLTAEGDAAARVTKAKGEAEELKLLARAHAEESRAQVAAITPLTVQMHAYDALGKLGGEGTTVLLGEWSHVPNFLFPRSGAFMNAYAPPFMGPSVPSPTSEASPPAANAPARTASK